VIELVRVLRRKGARVINLNVNKLRTRSCIIDGEAAAMMTAGRASTASAIRRHDTSVFLYAFDLIELNGDYLRHVFDEFCEREAHWLDNYALFRALKVKGNGVNYLEWPVELVERSPLALSTARQELAEAIAQARFVHLLCREGSRPKEYENSKRLRLIGDLPFYVAGGFVRRVDRSWTVQAR
jgi:4-alpha-glucanotransferase